MRIEVEQRLLRRHPHVPAGVVLAAVGRAVRQRARTVPPPWRDIEAAADEQLLLRHALRVNRSPPAPSG